MKLWMIPLLVLLGLWLFSLVRAGALVRYDDTGLWAAVRIGPLKITLFPRKRKDKPSKQKKKAGKKPEPVPERKKKGGNLELAQKLLPLAAEAAGRFRKKIRIDEIDMELTWGSRDPAAAALGYGYANAALGMLWPLIEHNFTVGKRSLRTSVDFDAEKPALYLRAAASLSIGQGAAMGILLGVKALRLYREYQKEQKRKKAA